MGLEEYNQKRDFLLTNEPPGELGSDAGELRFVVQRHEARRLHFDLRIEMDGVLKSWAIPKGPSLNPKDKRLAVQTEDHPMKYLEFHGTIPKGNYGAGKMTIWDSGTFSPTDRKPSDMEFMFREGDMKITFFGTKLRGDFALVRTGIQAKQPQWLLIKKKDEMAIDLEYDANLHLDKPTDSEKSEPQKLSITDQISPMLASSSKELKFNTSKAWIYEIKWDGYRAICNHSLANTSLYSRNGIPFTDRFPSLAEQLKLLPKSAILDGEIVALDKEGVSKFQWLQHYADEPKGDLIFMVFDLLFLDGHSIIHLPLTERKELLESLIADIPQLRYSDHVVGKGKALFEEMKERGLEGIIGKKADSKYFPGIRSDSWLKFKTYNSLDAIICGYTKSENRPFGSLILGLEKDGNLTYIGNCGTGFSEKLQKELLSGFEKIKQPKSPFNEKIALAGREPIWLKPELIVEVTFAEWTESDRLRHPVYKALRNEIMPTELRADSKEKPSAKSNEAESKPLQKGSLDIDGVHVPVTNLEKVLWPKEGISKYDLIDYYLAVSEYMLPFLIDRPQNLHRHPNGIDKKGFYQKDTPETYPEWVKTTSVFSESTNKNIDYMLCQDEATLVYMANLGCIEINPWNARVGNLDNPDYIVIDLDPSEKNTFGEVVEVAQAFYELLKNLEIQSHCKTSGASGLHIYIPLGAKYSFEQGREFCKLLCSIIQERLPKLTTMKRKIVERNGRIYLDYLQNRTGQTLAAVYSVRPQPNATVSTPLLWKEVNRHLNKSDFTIFSMKDRIAAHPDLFKDVLGKGVEIAEVLEKIDEED
jgi:bifunctional non-homologous end joining protein LigD